ncbi:MAG TPA: hypothetical protein VD970_08585 [Acetobacteraceae bacterium]|nr:hypothetical protein [Acetobacteraceae bacterium]
MGEQNAAGPVLGFLQNAWVRDVARCEAILAQHDSAGKRYIQTAWLFMGCLTGRRLIAAFGDDLAHDIVWDNASPRLADASSGAFPPDPAHIRAVLAEVRPRVVLAFGRIAEQGVRPLWSGPLIVGPHPTARGADTVSRLRAMAAELDAFLKAPATEVQHG